MQGNRRARRLGAAGSLALVALVAAPPVHAASSVRAGWWTSAPATAAADVKGGALLVEGGTDPANPVAFAAVAYPLATGEQPVSLTLGVAGGSASTPGAKLSACPLTASFEPAEGGPMADAPTFDCATRITASAAGDGKSYTFDVSQLASSGAVGSVNLAILPTAATDRVVLAPPAPESLKTSMGDAPSTAADVTSASSDPTSDPSAGTSTDAAFAIPPDLTAGPPADLGVATPTPAADTAAPVTPSRSTTTTTTAPPRNGTTAAAVQPLGSSSHGFPRAVLALGAVVLAGGLWFRAGLGREGDVADEDAVTRPGDSGP